jgi:hypothetical protein
MGGKLLLIFGNCVVGISVLKKRKNPKDEPPAMA